MKRGNQKPIEKGNLLPVRSFYCGAWLRGWSGWLCGAVWVSAKSSSRPSHRPARQPATAPTRTPALTSSSPLLVPLAEGLALIWGTGSVMTLAEDSHYGAKNGLFCGKRTVGKKKSARGRWLTLYRVCSSQLKMLCPAQEKPCSTWCWKILHAR